MQELSVEFNDLQKTLAPVFEGKTVYLVLRGNTAEISLSKPSKNRHRAFGILNQYIENNAVLSSDAGSIAWAEAAKEKYEKGLCLDENSNYT